MLDSLLKPSSVAVIGASRTPGTIGYETLHNLLLGGFTGAVYPVNPHAASIHSVRAYPSVSDLPEAPELAIVVVPKEHVAAVVKECGEVGVRGLVVITAGFKEVGGAGVERERELLALVRRYGMRMVGPNCMGLLNLAPDISLNGTFAPSTPPRGTIAFMSQSGAMGVTILDYAAEFGIGVSSFVSMGNKADVSSNDLLEYWREDPDVGVILMYLENFGNPRHFPLIARETTRTKPVIAVKAGRSRAGARAATSHTGALAAVDVATDALFAQCGVIRMDTVAGLFDAAMAFSSGPLPSGPNVAIVTNAGGPGIIIADACEATGLEVAPLSEESQARLRSGLPAEASVVNPVDMIASARAEDYRKALEVVLEDPKVDAVIAAFVPPLGIDQVEITRAIRDVAAERSKPVMAVLMGREGLPQGMAELREAKIPAYIFPESAARALAATYRYRRWLDRPAGEVVSFDVDVEKAGELLSATRLAGHEMVPLDVALEVLNAYGIPVAAHRVVKTVDEAVQAAGELEYPVVLKAISPALLHKTEQGGVAVDIETEEGLRAAFERMESDVGEGDGTRPRYLVQEMLPGGKEVIVGMSLEPNFGPLLMFGLGGIYVEAIGDIVFRAHPVSDVDASDMVRSVRGLPLLEGVRGEPGVDLRTLSEVIQRTSQLIGTHEEIVELDINPFLAFPEPDRCVAVDARIRLTRP